MQRIVTQIDIDASPAAVWTQLTDFQAYPEWNPHVVSAAGDLREGATLDIVVSRAGQRDRGMAVRITTIEPGRRLAWVGRFGHRALFEGEHTFELVALEGGRTRLHNVETVSGLLAGFVTADEPEREYEAMNRALKARVEGVAGVEAN